MTEITLQSCKSISDCSDTDDIHPPYKTLLLCIYKCISLRPTVNIALNFHSMHYEHGCMVNRGHTCVRPTVCVVHVLYISTVYSLHALLCVDLYCLLFCE